MLYEKMDDEIMKNLNIFINNCNKLDHSQHIFYLWRALCTCKMNMMVLSIYKTFRHKDHTCFISQFASNVWDLQGTLSSPKEII
jgi:hypothetical protein